MIKAFVLAAVFTLSGFGVAEKVNVDTEASSVKWVGKKVTGKHNGSIALKGGRLEMEDGKLTGGLFTIDMASIVCEDLSGGGKKKLEGHLKNADFFDVEKFPTATFVITKAVPQGPGSYKVVGNITIKGITEEIQFPATIEEKDGKYVATADLTIDRSKFNVQYGSGSFFDNLGDKTIYDDFELSVELVTGE
ncbi:MAG: YceI family protein [Bacteroidota bacterium]